MDIRSDRSNLARTRGTPHKLTWELNQRPTCSSSPSQPMWSQMPGIVQSSHKALKPEAPLKPSVFNCHYCQGSPSQEETLRGALLGRDGDALHRIFTNLCGPCTFKLSTIRSSLTSQARAKDSSGLVRKCVLRPCILLPEVCGFGMQTLNAVVRISAGL